MESKNIVFIAKSLDGFIAGKNGETDWLHSIPNPQNEDMGFNDLMSEVDAIVMGKTTFTTVLEFGVEWPYIKPVFVLSRSLKDIPAPLQEKVFILKGSPEEVLKQIHAKGFLKLYIDGGQIIQQFLQSDLIDELRITTLPILLGGGFPLFGDLESPLKFEHVRSHLFLNQLVQNHYRRVRT